MFLVKLENTVNSVSDVFGRVSAVLFVLMLFNVFYDVLMRYVFNDVSIGMQELEWHLFAAVFMLGVPYTLRAGGHVRVDLIYERTTPKAKAIIDLVGCVVFLLPFTLLVAWYGIGFAYEAYELGETSGDPGGLPYRWIIKALIPFAFFATAIAGVGMILHSINILRGVHQDDDYTGVQH
ncbi:MAG: TRAP transporter small permease subunit [Pontibacterium sp.]